MATKNITKVGTPEAAPKKEQPVKVERIAFIKSDAAKDHNDINDDDRFTHGDITGYDTKLHKAPTRRDFANDFDFLLFRADLVELQANKFAERATKLRTQAEELQKYGDPAQRAKVKRAQRLRDQLAELREALEAEGIEVPEL